MKLQNVDKYAKQVVVAAGGKVEQVNSNIEILPGKFLKEFEVTMPEGTLSLSQENAMSNLLETYYLLPSEELVVVYRDKLDSVHPSLEDAYKAEVRKANSHA